MGQTRSGWVEISLDNGGQVKKTEQKKLSSKIVDNIVSSLE